MPFEPEGKATILLTMPCWLLAKLAKDGRDLDDVVCETIKAYYRDQEDKERRRKAQHA